MNWTPTHQPKRRPSYRATHTFISTYFVLVATAVVSLCLADDCSRLWLKGYKLSKWDQQQQTGKPPILKTYSNYDVGQCEAECASTIGCSAFAVGTSRLTNGTCELGAAPPRSSRSLNSTTTSSSPSDCVERQPSFDVYVIHDADSCRKKRDPLYQPSSISSHNQHNVPIDCFYRLMSGRRLAKPHALKSISVNSLQECQEGCIHEKSFQCRSISYRYMPSGYSYSVSNCELSPFYLTNDRQQPHQQQHDFIDDFDYDFFQREPYCKTDASSQQNTFGVCAVVVRRGGRLTPSLARQSSSSPTSQQCEHLCTTSLFRCRAFAFRHTERGRYTVGGGGSRSSSSIRSEDSCLLYETELSRLPSYNVEQDPDFDLYEMGRLMNGKCMLDQQRGQQNQIYTPERYPPVTSTLRPDRYPLQHHNNMQGGYYPPRDMSYYPGSRPYDRPQDRQDYYGHHNQGGGGVTGSKYDGASSGGSSSSSIGGGSNYPQVTGTHHPTGNQQHQPQRPTNVGSSWGSSQGHQPNYPPQQPHQPNYPPPGGQQQQHGYYPPSKGHHPQQQQDFFSNGGSSSSGSGGGSSYYPPQQHQSTRPGDDRLSPPSNLDQQQRPPYPRPRPFEDEDTQQQPPQHHPSSDRPPPSPPSGDFPPPPPSHSIIGPPTGSTNPLRPLEPPVSFMDKVDHHTPHTQQIPSPHDETGITNTNKDFYDPKMEVCLRPLRHDAWLVPEVSRATFPVKTLEECRVECIRATDVLRFPCRTMAYHHTSSSGGTCQLSDTDGRDLRETDYVMSRDTGNNRFSSGGGVTLYYDESNPQCPVRHNTLTTSSRYPPQQHGAYYPPAVGGPSSSYPPTTNYHHQQPYYPPGGITSSSSYPPSSYDSSSRGYTYQQYDHYHDNQQQQQQRPSDFYNSKFNRVQYGSASSQNYGGGGGGGGHYGSGGGSSGGGYYDYQQHQMGGAGGMTTTVDGERCLHSCVRNQDAGFYYCQIDREGAWNFCCRPDEGGECGYSRGLSFSWCYVGTGPSRNIWRTCNYRGSSTSNSNAPYNSRYTSTLPHVSYLHDRQPPTVQKLAVSELANLTRDDAAILFKENNKDSPSTEDNDTVVIHTLLETNNNSTSPSNNTTSTEP